MAVAPLLYYCGVLPQPCLLKRPQPTTCSQHLYRKRLDGAGGRFHSHCRMYPEMKTFQGKRSKKFTLIEGKKRSPSSNLPFFVQTHGADQKKDLVLICQEARLFVADLFGAAYFVSATFRHRFFLSQTFSAPIRSPLTVQLFILSFCFFFISRNDYVGQGNFCITMEIDQQL